MPADIAKRLLEGEGMQGHPAGAGAMSLIIFAETAPGVDYWLLALEDADTPEIIAAIAGLGSVSTSSTPTQIAFREAARSMGEQRLSEKMVREMKRLERVGIALAVVGLLVAIPSCVIAINQLRDLLS